MADAISDRARMSTGGGSSERAAAATFAEYDREDDLRAAGADAPTDEGRLSESLQQKEVGVATSLQDAQVQLDNLRGSTALTSMKLEVASALHPEEEALIEGFSTAAALAMPEIQDAMKAWFPELTETFIQFMMVDEKTDEESVRSFTQDLPELLEPVVMSLFKMCLPIMETQVADLVEAQLEKVTEPDIVNTVVYATDEIEKSLKDIKRLQHEINGVMTEYAALKTPQPESKTAAAEARVRKETLEQDVKIINQMRTHNKVISDTYEQEAAIIKEQELLQARDTEIRAVKKSGTATIDTESAIQYGKITDPNSANLLEKIEQDMDKDKVKVNLTAIAWGAPSDDGVSAPQVLGEQVAVLVQDLAQVGRMQRAREFQNADLQSRVRVRCSGWRGQQRVAVGIAGRVAEDRVEDAGRVAAEPESVPKLAEHVVERLGP